MWQFIIDSFHGITWLSRVFDVVLILLIWSLLWNWRSAVKKEANMTDVAKAALKDACDKQTRILDLENELGKEKLRAMKYWVSNVVLPCIPPGILSWDQYFMLIARVVASRSKDPSTQCGAVVVDQWNQIVSTGYNGYVSGVNDYDGSLEDRPQKYERTIHAEQNALLNSPKRLDGCRIYVWPVPPCGRCMSFIAQKGITEVHTTEKPTGEYARRWELSNHVSCDIAAQKHITIHYHGESK